MQVAAQLSNVSCYLVSRRSGVPPASQDAADWADIWRTGPWEPVGLFCAEAVTVSPSVHRFFFFFFFVLSFLSSRCLSLCHFSLSCLFLYSSCPFSVIFHLHGFFLFPSKHTLFLTYGHHSLSAAHIFVPLVVYSVCWWADCRETCLLGWQRWLHIDWTDPRPPPSTSGQSTEPKAALEFICSKNGIKCLLLSFCNTLYSETGLKCISSSNISPCNFSKVSRYKTGKFKGVRRCRACA